MATGHDCGPNTKTWRDDTRFCNRLYDAEIRKVLCSTNAIESLNRAGAPHPS